MFQGSMPVKLSGCIAGTGLTAAAVQYKFVKISADNAVVLCAAATDIPIGVIQSPVNATGDPVDVTVVGETLIQADASLTAGNLIGTSADGQADAKTVATDSTEYVVGAVVKVNGATTAAQLITAVINCANPHRAS